MNAKINQIRQRHAANLQAVAMITEVMLLSEFLDRSLLELSPFTFADVEIYGKAARIVRFSGVDYTIYCNGIEWSISELATEAVEYAFGIGLRSELTFAA